MIPCLTQLDFDFSSYSWTFPHLSFSEFLIGGGILWRIYTYHLHPMSDESIFLILEVIRIWYSIGCRSLIEEFLIFTS